MTSDVTASTGRLIVGLSALLLFFGPTFASFGQSSAAFVSGSSRAENSAVLQILLGSDLTDATAAARALGERRDPYVGDILAGLFSRMAGPQSYRYGLLFREVVEYVLLKPLTSQARIEANRAELAVLLGKLQSISDPPTKRALLETSIYLPETLSQKALLDEGVFLETYLRQNGGHLSPGRLDEALGFVVACDAHSNEVLRAEVVGLIELARDVTFVRAARAYLKRSE